MGSSPAALDRVIDDAAWDAHLGLHPEATFYHSRVWSRIVRAAFPDVVDASAWIDGPLGRAAIPLYAWKRLRGAWIVRQSSFPFLYGGPVPRRSGGEDLLPRVLDRLARGGASLEVLTNPFAPGAVEPPRGTARSADSTQILRLPARYEDYWEGVLTSAKRNDVRRLQKRGVSIRRDGGPGEIAAVYGFYRQSFVRWGGPPGFVYPEALYRAMILQGEGAVRLYLAEHEERTIGGAFVIFWNGHVHYQAGYFDAEARALRPNVLLQERIVRDAIEEGCRDYDFLPSGGNAGVMRFKEEMGGSPVAIERYLYRPPLHALADRLRGRSRSPEPA